MIENINLYLRRNNCIFGLGENKFTLILALSSIFHHFHKEQLEKAQLSAERGSARVGLTSKAAGKQSVR